MPKFAANLSLLFTELPYADRFAASAAAGFSGVEVLFPYADVAATLAGLPPRETHLICGMLNTKDIAGYLRPLAARAEALTAVSIPGEANTLSAIDTADIAAGIGMDATTAPSVAEGVSRIADSAPYARILICGSLYLAGRILQHNG